jgi:uncharacterized protein involved in tolerance to divalent cations
MSTTFDSTKRSLHDFLRDVHSGKLKLPDFQRGWVWDDSHILGLLTSIAQSFPIGAVMLLQSGNEDVRFKERLVEGVDNPTPEATENLILDGQQRLTSLYQSLFSKKAVATKDGKSQPVSRWYYIDMRKALGTNGDMDEAIFSTPEDRVFKNFRGEPIEGRDFSTMEKEFAACVFPLCEVFSSSTWRSAFNKHHGYSAETSQLWDAFEEQILERFKQYQIPQIVLLKQTPKVAVCQVFEKVNTGGVSLTVFELLTATFAVDNFNLRDDWAERDTRLKKHRALMSVENTDFLQAITLLVTQARRSAAAAQGVSADQLPAISCKRRDVLKMTTEDYKTWANQIEKGLIRAAKFLTSQRIYSSRDLPYRTQLVPMAAIYATLGNDSDTENVRAKIERWFWCGVFGELYGGAVETRSAKDLPEVLAWIKAGPEPSTVDDCHFAANRLYSLRTRNSAAYKGLHALVLRQSVDFRSGADISIESYFDEKLDIHHIFPRDWCDHESRRIPAAKRDSIINKTAISARTNRSIGGRAPSEYLQRLRNSAGCDEMRQREILETHLIDFDALSTDDFDQFLTARETALTSLIENATGKSVSKNAPTISDLESDEADDTSLD